MARLPDRSPGAFTLAQGSDHCFSFIHANCEDEPAEAAALNQVTQSISRFG
jgi:hypothetical protein